MTIRAITGLNGAGKSALAVKMLLAAQKKGFTTASNVKVNGAVHVRDYEHLMSLRNCLLLLDDVSAVASSRNYAALTPEAVLFFQTLRHHDVSLIWTAPTFDRADVLLRSITREWTDVRPLLSTRRAGSLWKSTRIAYTLTGSPKTDPLSDGGYKILNPWLDFFRPSTVHQEYDSFADLDLFTPEKFPTRCRDCGAVLMYPRVKASEHKHQNRVDARAELLEALENHVHTGTIKTDSEAEQKLV